MDCLWTIWIVIWVMLVMVIWTMAGYNRSAEKEDIPFVIFLSFLAMLWPLSLIFLPFYGLYSLGEQLKKRKVFD